MKKSILFIAALLCSYAVFAVEYSYKEATELTITGKAFESSLPYERMDFDRWGGWEDKDINLLKQSTGIMVSFKTDSPSIAVKASFYKPNRSNTSGYANRGFDLYIKKGGKWLWAGARSANSGAPDFTAVIVRDMNEDLKECLLYLPTTGFLTSVQVGVEEGCKLEAGEQPFRHKIILHGSSFMHGISTTRAAASVPCYLSRMTGLMFCNLGVSGDCTMQPQFANALKDAECEAFVFDSFSNPSAEVIEERLFPFIETIQKGHPGVPLIFMSSIWRENRNFNNSVEEKEAAKAKMAEKMMAKAVKKYKDVYFIQSNASTDDHETTCDGTHPGDLGYYLWAQSVKDPILEILAKYGIK